MTTKSELLEKIHNLGEKLRTETDAKTIQSVCFTLDELIGKLQAEELKAIKPRGQSGIINFLILIFIFGNALERIGFV